MGASSHVNDGGGYEKEDGVSRSLIPRGERHDIDPGHTVPGVPRVIEPAGYTVTGVEVPARTEVRAEPSRGIDSDAARWYRGRVRPPIPRGLPCVPPPSSCSPRSSPRPPPSRRRRTR